VSGYSTGDPWLSDDGQYLYFASDRPGGQGGIDLWRCQRHGQSWSLPENLKDLNTELNERSPRFDTNGNFYYASDNGGRGGLDIYSCALLNDGHFTTPIRMAEPLNSTSDDFAISFTGEKTGYFTSNRTGRDAIYQFDKLGDESLTKITIVDHNSKLLPGAQVCFMSEEASDSKVYITDEKGVVIAKLVPDAYYSVLVYKEDFMPLNLKDETSEKLNNRTLVLEPIPVCLCPDPDDVTTPLPETEGYIDRPVQIAVHFDLNKADIRPDAANELNRLVHYLVEHPWARLEVSAYTDCRGSAAFNLLLSQKRANAVRTYLVKQGIAANRITAMGYGKTRLLNRCDCSYGIDCSDREHEMNRRAEYKIITK
jgi:outer membrane protein OmpA-like peptidoglycan-associated protein